MLQRAAQKEIPLSCSGESDVAWCCSRPLQFKGILREHLKRLGTAKCAIQAVVGIEGGLGLALEANVGIDQNFQLVETGSQGKVKRLET